MEKIEIGWKSDREFSPQCPETADTQVIEACAKTLLPALFNLPSSDITISFLLNPTNLCLCFVQSLQKELKQKHRKLENKVSWLDLMECVYLVASSSPLRINRYCGSLL